MGVLAKMVTLWIYITKSPGQQHSIVAALAIVGCNIAVSPLSAIRDVAESTVAIEKNMWDRSLRQHLMHTPDLVMGLLRFLPPIYIHDISTIAIFQLGGNLIYA